MGNFLVNSEGYLTGAGYVAAVIAGILLLAVGVYFARRGKQGRRISTKQLAFCGMAMAIAFLTSYIKIFQLPWGGSVTLCSMLFIVLIGNWYGVRTGIFVGCAYGILQFLQEPYVLSLFQVCCDYWFAFAAMGIAGFFMRSKNGLLKGYVAAVLARGAFHSLGGYLYWMDYMPENFPQALKSLYPILYNYSYILAEAILTIIIISIPAVAKSLNRIKQLAQ